MFIAKGVSFLLSAGKRIETVQLAGIKIAYFPKDEILKRFHFFDIYTI